jgi:hypothetical protein
MKKKKAIKKISSSRNGVELLLKTENCVKILINIILEKNEILIFEALSAIVNITNFNIGRIEVIKQNIYNNIDKILNNLIKIEKVFLEIKKTTFELKDNLNQKMLLSCCKCVNNLVLDLNGKLITESLFKTIGIILFLSVDNKNYLLVKIITSCFLNIFVCEKQIENVSLIIKDDKDIIFILLDLLVSIISNENNDIKKTELKNIILKYSSNCLKYISKFQKTKFLLLKSINDNFLKSKYKILEVLNN